MNLVEPSPVQAEWVEIGLTFAEFVPSLCEVDLDLADIGPTLVEIGASLANVGL